MTTKLSIFLNLYLHVYLKQDSSNVIRDIVAKFEHLEAQVYQLQTNDIIQRNLIEKLKEEMDQVNAKYAVQEVLIQSLLKYQENKKDNNVHKMPASSLISSIFSHHLMLKLTSDCIN